jgi:hypothetical protein
MKKVALTMVLVFGLAASAQASLTTVVDPGVDVGGGLVSYTVHLVADTEADMLAAFDGTFSGTLNQVFAFGGALDTPTLDNVSYLPAEDAAKDTHFMLEDDELLVVTDPNETESTLNGVFSVAVASRSLDLVIAQIVLAAGDTAELSGLGANAAGDKFDISATIPEPATLSLLGIGALALIRRRKTA